ALFGRAVRLCRDARHPREDRPFCAARHRDGKRARARDARAGPLSVKKGTAPDVGSFVELKARLMPPLAPLRPGSYDFPRDLVFQGIGASGFAMGAIRTA